ncbi:DegV family protein [Deinococcus soli (ex Cha et al. 2016)]|uniref:DegV family protein with EDD domain n=2 Tax=Deinococcus soli (ex Cha et al. 2016) TaxID=1309411 RepID=A0A0F7JKY1_9DEIO|nr:DegV family protein [Deinococcus soli (ex Cha et al. 2016)]AKH15984.1 fatty acid-binding protein DegV [Deinococcus soli (ex Cha et al. 2016)]MDR6217249.1 DegV family protein with EDD domain [Deinococcus soli (ex Cha et al. 2016)]MDR6326558.1 DegV family protein with EDD domain [Deinococcus soli (ex Cha et al. 2016)]MDR6750715.1 DegV family protein with EDD domain [Deinococcus soli (ex Cha et al. 2016)]
MIAVLTDSTCDLHPDSAAQLGINIIPLQVSMQQRTFSDWQDIDPDAVYDHMRAGGSASTSPVSVAAFEQRYRELLSTHDAVISLHISGKLSETVRHAQQAAQQLGEAGRIQVVDTEVACGPLAELALVARDQVTAGRELHQVARAVLEARNSMYAELSVATLDYLRRSGRVSRAQAFLGGMLGVRPVLTFERGELKATRRAKVDQAAGDMLGSLKERFGDTPLSVTIMHAGRDTARINALRTAMVGSGLNVQRGRVQLMGPVIGAHVGPGTYGFNAIPIG